MNPILRATPAFFAALALMASPTILAQGKGHDKDRGDKPQKEHAQKQHKHKNGKDLLGDRIKTNGKHKLETHGKHTAYANVKDGKVAGVSVTDDKGAQVPVKKYKTSKKMAGPDGYYGGSVQPVNLILAQSQYMGTTYIGYSYIDEWGDEVIYWYPYDMIYDGDTGAVEYVAAY